MKELYLVDGILHWSFENKFYNGGPNSGHSFSGSDRSESYIVVANSYEDARNKFLEHMKTSNEIEIQNRLNVDKTRQIENKSNQSLETRISVYEEAFTVIK